MDFICLDCEVVHTLTMSYSKALLQTIVVKDTCPECGGSMGIMVDYE